MNRYLRIALWISFGTVLLFSYSGLPDLRPQGMHSWAQADRYALALRYLDQVNFFKPATLNLMSENGRVGVEFPLLPYVAARISTFTGTDTLPVVMRLLNLLLLLGGFLFFIRSIDAQSLLKLPAFFMLWLTPILFFYSFGFLPDTTGLAFLLISFGHLFRYQRDNGSWFWAMIFGALATLIKTSCGVYFIALSASLIIHRFRKSGWRSSLLPTAIFFIACLIIVGYDYYFFYRVNRLYWAVIFMSESQPIQTMAQFDEVRKSLFFWFGQWITVPTVVMLITFFTIRIRSHRQLTSTPVALTAVFSILGVAGFTVLMGRQFVNHDYYFIAVFIPFLFLLLGLFLNGMDNRLNQLKSWVKYGVIALGFLAFAASAVFGWRQFRDRSQEVFVWRNRPILNETNWMANGDEALTSLGISPDARIFVCYVFAPNTSLIYFNRQGRIFNHEEMTREPENIEYWLQRIDPQYVIVPAKWNPHLHRDQPDFERELTFFGETETFLVYTRK